MLVTSLLLLTATSDPAALMRDSDRRHRVNSEINDVQIVLRDDRGGSKSRIARIAITQRKNEGDKMRVQFTAPGSVKGTTLLSIDGEDQWLYLPAFSKTRRLGRGELGDRFAETDLSYEDLLRRDPDEYDYVYEGETTLDGEVCHVITGRPKSARTVEESPYGRTKVWLRKSDLFVMRLRHFDREDRAWKEVRFEGPVAVGKGVVRPDRISVTDVKRRHQTVMLVTKRAVDKDVPTAWLSSHTFHR